MWCDELPDALPSKWEWEWERGRRSLPSVDLVRPEDSEGATMNKRVIVPVAHYRVPRYLRCGSSGWPYRFFRLHHMISVESSYSVQRYRAPVSFSVLRVRSPPWKFRSDQDLALIQARVLQVESSRVE